MIQNLYDEPKPYFQETDCKLLIEQSFRWKEDEYRESVLFV